eukprot:GHRQ01014286.1.p2 GENE.GHRQ01014286.1~~GHRQ01014286.1.p2  ORF type:complete len:154 (-),score=27.06 GHRQ01014286.1:1566-2027(-)
MRPLLSSTTCPLYIYISVQLWVAGMAGAKAGSICFLYAAFVLPQDACTRMGFWRARTRCLLGVITPCSSPCFPACCCVAAAFRESIHMGETDLTAAQVQHLVQQMGHHYKGNKYHLLQLNCNHFASDMCLQLTAKPVPSWVSSHWAQQRMRKK